MEFELLEESKVEANKAVISERIKIGLKLEEKFPDWKDETREVFEDTVTQTYAECLVILNLEPADTFGYVQEQNADKCQARMVGPPFEFRFSEIFLEQFEKDYGFIGGVFSEISLKELRSLVAHESYHQREAIKFPSRGKRKGGGRLGAIKSQTLNDRSERAADIFALGYIKHRGTSGFAEKIGKLVAEIGLRFNM